MHQCQMYADHIALFTAFAYFLLFSKGLRSQTNDPKHIKKDEQPVSSHPFIGGEGHRCHVQCQQQLVSI